MSRFLLENVEGFRPQSLPNARLFEEPPLNAERKSEEGRGAACAGSDNCKIHLLRTLIATILFFFAADIKINEDANKSLKLKKITQLTRRITTTSKPSTVAKFCFVQSMA